MDGATQPHAELLEAPQPGTLELKAEAQMDSARVADLLDEWRVRELRIAHAFKECRGLSDTDLDELYQLTTEALLHRPYKTEKHLQNALRYGMKRRAQVLTRDERTRAEILAENAPGIHVLEQARSAEASPEQLTLLREDRLLATEFLAELTKKERPVFWLMAEGLGFHRIAKVQGIPVNEARKLTRACEHKADQFQALYEAGRLCGSRTATIHALQNGEATSEELALLALAHLNACAHCRAEHKTNARRLKRAFQGQAAALIPVPALAARLGWLARAGLRTRALHQRLLTDGITVSGGGVRERAVALLAGSGASAKLAAGAMTAAVLAGSAIGATHALEHHNKPHTSATTAPLSSQAAHPVDLVQSALAAPAGALQRRLARTAAHNPPSPGHVVAVPRPAGRRGEIRREPGGFAYLGVPATRTIPRRSEPAQTATHTGGPFSP